jgi:hypothetical protein
VAVSIKVKARLRQMNLLFRTTHEDRVKIDEEIERRTGQYCDEGIDKITDDELREIVEMILKNKELQRKKQTNTQDERVMIV